MAPDPRTVETAADLARQLPPNTADRLVELANEVHGLKAHVMEMEDRLTKRIDDGFAAVDQRFDALEKLIRDSLNGHGS